MGQARRKSKPVGKANSSHGLGMFVSGLVVGAVGALFVVGMRSDDPESIGRGIEHLMATSKSRFEQQPVEESDTVPAPRDDIEYLFYELLPEVEHIVPDIPPPQVRDESDGEPDEQPTVTESEPGQQEVIPPSPTRSAAPGILYELQAGAFARMNDADRLRARLALEGLESRIQKVSIEGRGDFFRVRLGPFERSDQLGEVDRKLASMGIKTLRLRISGS